MPCLEDDFQCRNAGGILAEKLDATIERIMESEYRATLLNFFESLVHCYQKMPDHERRALDEWEKENLGRDPTGVPELDAIGTADWPGWQRMGITPPARWRAAVAKAAAKAGKRLA